MTRTGQITLDPVFPVLVIVLGFGQPPSRELGPTAGSQLRGPVTSSIACLAQTEHDTGGQQWVGRRESRRGVLGEIDLPRLAVVKRERIDGRVHGTRHIDLDLDRLCSHFPTAVPRPFHTYEATTCSESASPRPRRRDNFDEPP